VEAKVPFDCADRGADSAPDCGPGAGRLAAGYIEPPELEESNSLALRLPAVAPGAFWESVASSPSRAGLALTGLASGLFARPLCLGSSPSFLLSYDVPLQLP
jgi:hypothetical protein